MKTKEELNAIKEEIIALNEKLRALSYEELEQVVGGRIEDEKYLKDTLKDFKITEISNPIRVG